MTIDRTKEPPFHSVEKVHLLQAEQKKLSNGIPVYLLDAGTQEVVRLEFIFDAGIRHQQRALTAMGVNDMLDEGTKTRNAESIAEELDYYGAFIESEVTHDVALFTLFSLNKHLKKTLPVIRDVLRNAIFPEKEFGLYMSNRKQRFQVDSEKVAIIARRRFSELVFGEQHPYGWVVKENDFDTVTREELADFFANRYHAGNCAIVVSGKLPDDLLQQLESWFGDPMWTGDATQNKLAAPVSAYQRVQTITKDGALQSAIRMGRVLFNKLHPDYHSFQVLNTVLGGYFGSRLMANIREDKGYTYGIGSGLVSLYDSGYFVISTEVGVDATNAALKEIYFEIEKLQNDLVSSQELDLVRNYMLGVFLRNSDGPFALADRLKSLLGYGLGYEYFDRYTETVLAIQPQAIRDLAQKYLKKEDLIELVAGERK
ncbi:MAG TPA: pitrilysin family protein [Bacteroidia bacterium]|nr:pitrilysin family protein [Bacteroidia bacterium]